MGDNGYIRFHTVIHNNQTFKIEDTIQLTGPDDIPSLSMLLNPEVQLPPGSIVYSVDYEEGRYQYYDKINNLKKIAKNSGDSKQWAAYHKYVAQFARFDYAYSLSSHKSQGRTFKDVIVFENDIMNVQKIN